MKQSHFSNVRGLRQKPRRVQVSTHKNQSLKGVQTGVSAYNKLVNRYMKITSVKIIPRNGAINKASVSIILNNALVMRGMNVIERQESHELVVLMPSYRRTEESSRSYFNPINNEAREKLSEVVLDAYQRVLENPAENTIQYDEEMNDPFEISSVRVSPIDGDRKVKALVSFMLEDSIALNQIRIIQPADGREPLLTMPARKVVRATKDGGEDEVSYIEYFHPLNKECRQALTEAALKAYEDALANRE